ncbi:MAG: M23 family metallopeptidase [Mariprofundaceae bacterium]
MILALTSIGIWPAQAAEWQVTQGDIAHVTLASDGEAPSLYCFGSKWPVKADGNGQWQGWIGVDMKQKPGPYQILWKGSDGQVSQQLEVLKGEFRISHIQVAKKMAEFDKPTLARIRSEVAALKATYGIKVDATPAISMNSMPIKGIISTPFGAQRYVNGVPRSPHSGLDIAAPAGTPVHTPLAGKVLLVAAMYLNGNTVAIGHGNGLVSVYSHMQSTEVHEGDWLDGGSVIGKVGATGRATGPHLHWGVRFYNARVNPDSLLNHPAQARSAMQHVHSGQ